MLVRLKWALPVVAGLAVAAGLLAWPHSPGPRGDGRLQSPRIARRPVADSERVARPDPRTTLEATPFVEFLRLLGWASTFNDRLLRERALRHIPPPSPGDREIIEAALTGRDMPVAVGAAEYLGLRPDRDVLAVLGRILRTQTWLYLQRAAIRALAEVRTAGARWEILSAYSAGPPPAVRWAILEALGAWRDDPDARRVLLQALSEDSDFEARCRAARALGGSCEAEALRALADRFEEEPDVRVQEALALALGELPIEDRPLLARRLEDRRRGGVPERYAAAFPQGFFEAGGSQVRFDPNQHRSISIVLWLPPGCNLREFVVGLLSYPPLDRYRWFFYFRDMVELESDLGARVPCPRAYDAWGWPIPGGREIGPLEGTVLVRFLRPEQMEVPYEAYAVPWESEVMLGRDCLSAACLAHEFAHAFAWLGDEYSDPRASTFPAANLVARGERPEWWPLAERGLVPASPLPRVERDAGGVDIGRWAVPMADCVMKSLEARRFCPVCALALIARICELTGAPVPW